MSIVRVGGGDHVSLGTGGRTQSTVGLQSHLIPQWTSQNGHNSKAAVETRAEQMCQKKVGRWYKNGGLV